MDHEIAQLEEKLARLIDEHQSVIAQNRDLRARLAHVEMDNKRLNDKLSEAVRRVEAALSNLPVEAT